MLPYLKNRDDGVGVGPAEVIERKPDMDDGHGFEMVDAIAEDMLMAFEKKDKGLLKDALKALCEYLQDMDAEQDAGAAG